MSREFEIVLGRYVDAIRTIEQRDAHNDAQAKEIGRLLEMVKDVSEQRDAANQAAAAASRTVTDQVERAAEALYDQAHTAARMLDAKGEPSLAGSLRQAVVGLRKHIDSIPF